MCNPQANYSRRGRQHHQHPFKNHFRNKMRAKLGVPPVNVEEYDDKYVLHVFAAGYSKSDFSVNLENDELTISAKVTADSDSDSGNWRRKEFRARGFERHFILNEKINKDAIAAAYKDGVLQVTLPKLEGFETVRTEVKIK